MINLKWISAYDSVRKEGYNPPYHIMQYALDRAPQEEQRRMQSVYDAVNEFGRKTEFVSVLRKTNEEIKVECDRADSVALNGIAFIKEGADWVLNLSDKTGEERTSLLTSPIVITVGNEKYNITHKEWCW